MCSSIEGALERGCSFVLSPIIRPPWIGEGAERLQKYHQVGLFALSQFERRGGLAIFGVQTRRIDIGIMFYDFSEFTPRRRLSVQLRSGTWQLAHDACPMPDRR